MSRNREVAAAFGAQLDPPREPVSVRNINGVPRRDAWMVALYDAEAEVGITAHVHGSQQLHAFVEVLGGAEDAGRVSALLASVVKAMRDERKEDGRAPEGHAAQADGDAPAGG